MNWSEENKTTLKHHKLSFSSIERLFLDISQILLSDPGRNGKLFNRNKLYFLYNGQTIKYTIE